MSYLPINSSGKGEKASSLCTATFDGNHCFGGAWVRSTSNPSNWAELGSVLDSSMSHILVKTTLADG